MNKYNVLEAATHDLVSNLLYYDRQEDEDLTREDINELLERENIKNDIIKWFTQALDEYIDE